MNEIINNEENFTTKLRNLFKNNYKIIIFAVTIFFLLYISYQLYNYYNENKILKTSILYNEFKKNLETGDFNKNLDKISNQKNFYSILATLEKIKIDLEKNKNIDLAYENYKNLLDKKKLSNLYKSAIATHASYSFLNQLDNDNYNSSLKIEETKKILINIKDFLIYIDPSLDSYEGIKLEILYLLSILENSMSNSSIYNEDSINLYNQIQEHEKVSNSIKERVQKIHEFQKNK